MDIKNNIQPIREFAEQLIKLMDEFESQLEPDIEEGDWFTHPSNSFIARVNEVEGRWADVTGIAATDKWVEHGDAYIGPDTDLRKATDSEVEKVLIKEAGSKYEIGQRVRCLHDNRVYRIESFGHHTAIDVEDESMWAISESGDGIKLYGKGDWAEVIEDEWEVVNRTKTHSFVHAENLVIDMSGKRSMTQKEAEEIRDALNDLEQS